MTGFLSLPLCSSCRYQILCSCTLFCNIKILVCEAISIFVEFRTALKSEVNLLRYRCFIRMMMILMRIVLIISIFIIDSGCHSWRLSATPHQLARAPFSLRWASEMGNVSIFSLPSKSSFYSVFQCFCPFLFLLSLSHAYRASGQFWQLYLQYERIPCSIRQRSQGTTLFSF